jgi:hypothetical protein
MLLTESATSLARLKHSARISSTDCLCPCAVASKIVNVSSAGTSKTNANRVFGDFRTIASLCWHPNNTFSVVTMDRWIATGHQVSTWSKTRVHLTA